MSTPRMGHTATLLPDGTVLIVGGRNGAAYLASAELYDPKTSKFTPTGSMSTPRTGHTATLLDNGKVLVAGGSAGSGSLASAELYDPKTGKFSPTGSMTTGRSQHTATLLDPGFGSPVLIAGGYGPSGNPLASAEQYLPTTGTFSLAASMTTARGGHTATLVAGHVLIAGGSKTPGGLGLASAEMYDWGTGNFSKTGSMTTGRDLHTATLLTNGSILITGGQGSDGALPSAELYDFLKSKFAATGSLVDASAGQTATLLPNGDVLVTGGRLAELYDPAKGTFAETETMAHDHNGQTATLLADGMVLVVGGTDGTAELYQPASSPTPAPSPTGTASPTPVLKTIQDLLASPHPTTTTAAVVAAIHAAFAADPSVTLEGSHPIFEAMFTGHPATPGFKPPVPMPHSSPVTYVCSYDSGPCGMGFLYGCAQNGMPWDGGHAPVNRIAQCNSEIGLLFQAYRATGHEAFYDATLTLYNYSVHAIPTQAAWLKANLLRDFA